MTSQSVPQLVSVIEDFGDLSGLKINWSKSAYLPLNEAANTASLPAEISVVQHLRYLGIEIFPSLNEIIKYNYNGVLNKVMNDLDRRSSIQNSLQGRISIIKMNIAPRVNFITQ